MTEHLAASGVANFAQLSIAGVTLGCIYALVALGFVVTYKATGILNFALGGQVLLGGYLTYNAHQSWGVGFVPAVLIAVAMVALGSALMQHLFLRRLVGQPEFAVIMATIGMLFVIQVVQQRIWGADNLNLGDPWGVAAVRFGGVAIQQKDLWIIGLTVAVLVCFATFFRYSRLGLGMRAVSIDHEAALAQGISVRGIYTLTWALSGAIGALAGALLMSGASQVSPSVATVALVAFPAIIFGGVDSLLGAVVGGVVIGVVQDLTAGYQPQSETFGFLGSGFSAVMPYALMVLVLVVRPHGLFGTKEIRRA